MAIPDMCFLCYRIFSSVEEIKVVTVKSREGVDKEYSGRRKHRVLLSESGPEPRATSLTMDNWMIVLEKTLCMVVRTLRAVILVTMRVKQAAVPNFCIEVGKLPKISIAGIRDTSSQG